MIHNRGSVLSKEYFIAFLKLVMTSFECGVDEAKERTFDHIFRGNKEIYGKDTFHNFNKAYEELSFTP